MSIRRNVACYQNRNPSQTFLWGQSRFQKLQKIVFDAVSFHRTMVYTPKTLLNSVTDGFLKVFWNICTKHLGQYSERACTVEFWTAGLKTSLQILVRVQKGKNVLKLQKFQKSPCKTFPFLLILQACRTKFPTSANTVTGSDKKNYCKCPEIFANLSGRSLLWSRFIEVIRLLSRSYTLLKQIAWCIFQDIYGKCAFWKFQKIFPEIRFSRVSFEQYKLFNLPAATPL